MPNKSRTCMMFNISSVKSKSGKYELKLLQKNTLALTAYAAFCQLDSVYWQLFLFSCVLIELSGSRHLDLKSQNNKSTNRRVKLTQ